MSLSTSRAARIGIALKSPLGLVLLSLFLATFLLRTAPFVRLDYAAWWDGAGWGYADPVWIFKALRLAEGEFDQLHFRSEGLMFVPMQAVFFKLFGIELGFRVWAWFLVATSALVVPIAAHTVYLATGRLLGAILTGSLVIFDPVAAWFGLNGWSDGQTVLAVALAGWTFMLCARQSTLSRQALLAVALSILALGHATWTYPAFAWALLAWPMLALRERWFPRAQPHGTRPSSFGWARTLPIPTLFLLIVLLSIFGISTLDNDADQAGGLGTLFGDTNNQRALVVTYDSSITWDEWETSDSLRVILTIFPPQIPNMLKTLVLGHLGNVIPLYRWLLLVITLAVFVIALSRWRSPLPSPIGLLAVPVVAILFLSQQALDEPTLAMTYLVLALAFMYIPIVRVLTLLFLPFIGLMLLFIPLLTQPRHTDAIVYYVFLVAGISVSLAFDSVANFRNWSLTGETKAFQLFPVFAALALLVAMGVTQTVDAVEDRRSEAQYLGWLSTQLDDKSILLTDPDVDPWEVRAITGATVVYDAQGGGRVVLSDDTPAWGVTASMYFGTPDSSTALFEELRSRGHTLWYYSPWDGADPDSILPNIIAEDPRLEFRLVPSAGYLEQPGRSALQVGPPVTKTSN